MLLLVDEVVKDFRNFLSCVYTGLLQDRLRDSINLGCDLFDRSCVQGLGSRC